MKKQLAFIFSLIVFFSINLFAEHADTSIVRLKSGAKMRGVISSSTEKTVTINVDNLGEKVFGWHEITFISSLSVYDSLKEMNSLIVLPAPIAEPTAWEKAWSAEFLFGNSFKYDRGLGFGVGGKFSFGEYFNAGALAIIHLGVNQSSQNFKYGPSFYWGPDLGFAISKGAVIFETSINFGQASIPVVFDERRIISESKFYFSPGIAVKADVGYMKIGLQFRYVMIESTQMPVLYILFGS